MEGHLKSSGKDPVGPRLLTCLHFGIFAIPLLLSPGNPTLQPPFGLPVTSLSRGSPGHLTPSGQAVLDALVPLRFSHWWAREVYKVQGHL